ncbi:MAG TPA: helix-hairpin-helix domain-containing protein [Thermoleophilaceae bacterium]|jgi:competence protein ComEA
MELDREKLRVAAWLAAAVVVALLAVRALTGGDGGASESVTVDPAGSAAESPGAAAPGGGGPGAGASGGGVPGAPVAGAPVFVHVAGEVRRPGVYRLPRGARVNDAVQLAGGLTRRAEQTGVNLVARVSDGQQVIVPRRGAAAPGATGATPGSAGSAGGGAAPGAKVSLAAATPEQLDGIDGIGPTLAKRIVEYREQHGGFHSVDELRQVDGIGEKRFESLREAVTP